MEKNKTIAMVITAAVAIIMVGSLLVPIINDAVDDTKVYYNNNFGAFADVSDNEAINLEITTEIGTAGSTKYYINGVELYIPQGGRVIVVSENLTISQDYANGIGITGVDSSGKLFRNSTDSLNIVINGESIAIEWALSTNSTSGTINVKSSWTFYRSFEGDWRAVDFMTSSNTVYINEFSQVYSSNWIGTTSEFFTLNGTSVKVYSGALGETATSSTATASVEVTDVMKGVKSFTISSDRSTSGAFKFTVDNAGEPYDVFPYYFIIPASVYGQTETNAAYAGVLAVLPILVICGIMVAVVATFRSKF